MRSRLFGPAFLLILALNGCRKAREAPPTFPKAPVILISVDTLRSDHLPFYGYKGVETPAFSALRADSVLFERAYAHVPLTLPSHVSLFTGLLPGGHGVHDNAGYRLKADVPTLAELMKKGGYRTGGAVSAFVLSRTSGIARGFDFYEDGIEVGGINLAASLIQRPGAETEALLSKWIDAQGDTPLFAFLHLYEPHTPYEPKEPYRSRYASSPYDGEIAVSDEIVGQFLAHLKERGIYDRALVIFLSDHGESLGEHGEDEHGIFLYRADLQVPLLLKLPGQKLGGTSVKDPVQLRDVFTTIGAVVGLTGFPEIPGNVSLAALAAGEHAPERKVYAETFFPRTHFGWAELASVLDGRWQYIDAPKPEFYDMESDPAEVTNLVEGKPGPLRAMKLELEQRRATFEAPGTIGEEEKKKLASLGYLSTGASTAGVLPDPKDEVGVVRMLKDAGHLAATGHPAEAITFYEQLLKTNPAMFDVWELYSEALLAVGRAEEALKAKKRVVELSPPYATVPLIGVATVYLQMGRPDEALKNAQLAKDRGDIGASETLARAYFLKGDLTRAEAEAKAGLEWPKVRKRSLLVLALVEAQRDRLAAALARLDEMKGGPDGSVPPGAHYLRGDILARMSRPGESEQEFKEEIRLFPGQLDARVGLATVYASLNRMADAKSEVGEMVEQVPTAEACFRGVRTLELFKDRPGAEALRREAAKRFPSDPRFKKGV